MAINHHILSILPLSICFSCRPITSEFGQCFFSYSAPHVWNNMLTIGLYEILLHCIPPTHKKQEAQLMLTTGSTRLAVNQGQQT